MTRSAIEQLLWVMDAGTRRLVNNVTQHDLYHAGEINHIRALHQRNDE